ncbi:MAG: hypothetical protein VX471_08335, partial [Acidobacteriota bacterium]|nr:hypothetical protein [Acidobacteriota bacterium]
MNKPLKVASVFVALLVTFALGWFLAATGTGQAADPVSLTDLDPRFTERMQNVALVGHFTIEGQETGSRTERYEISRVVKVGDDQWRFDVHMVYGGVDVTLPVVVPIVWAGDTPMVSITDFSIPTLGTFTARVFFYDDRYGGSWQHGRVGGLMYGH